MSKNTVHSDPTKQLTIKAPDSLLQAFKASCAGQDETASQAIRAFMRDYVKKHGQGKLF